MAYIHGGASAPTSHNEIKRLSQAVCSVLRSIETRVALRWSHVPITFSQEDRPDRNAGVGDLPLVVFPIINNVIVSKMLVDGGSSLNLISTRLMKKLQISRDRKSTRLNSSHSGESRMPSSA